MPGHPSTHLPSLWPRSRHQSADCPGQTGGQRGARWITEAPTVKHIPALLAKLLPRPQEAGFFAAAVGSILQGAEWRFSGVTTHPGASLRPGPDTLHSPGVSKGLILDRHRDQRGGHPQSLGEKVNRRNHPRAVPSCCGEREVHLGSHSVNLLELKRHLFGEAFPQFPSAERASPGPSRASAGPPTARDCW